MNRMQWSLTALLIMFLPAFSHAAQPGFARISLIDGEALIRTEESPEWLPAAVNTPLYEGDSVWSPEGSRVEVQLQNGSRLRLNERSSLDVLVLETDAQQFNLGMGNLYVRAGKMKDNGLQIDVNDTSVTVYENARFRVDITDSGDEEVSIFKGSAYVEGSGGRTRVRTGEMLSVEGSRTELAPLNPPDAWERWNHDRDQQLAARKRSAAYLPEELAVYSNDLDANGEWVEVQEYGRVWRPTVIVTGEWSPYQVGRWLWRGGDYIWISSESWGWAPYHYGRWVVIPSRGWCWVPPARADVFWSPGYVGWVTTPTHVGWVPLAPGEVYYGRGYYGRNSVNITNVNITRTNIVYRNVAVNNAVTVVPRNAFAAGRAERVRVRENIFAQRNAAIGRPDVKPSREALMPVVRRVSPAKLPPARVASVQPRELRERHPRLIESPVAPVPRNGTTRRGPEQTGLPAGRQPVQGTKPQGKERPALPRQEGAASFQGRSLTQPERTTSPPPAYDTVQRSRGADKPSAQQQAAFPKPEIQRVITPVQAGRQGVQQPVARAKGEGRVMKAWRIKQEEPRQNMPKQDVPKKQERKEKPKPNND